jgi:hypothetical protein
MSAPNVSVGAVAAVAERCISHGRSLAIAAEPSYRTSMGWLAAMAQAWAPLPCRDEEPVAASSNERNASRHADP